MRTLFFCFAGAATLLGFASACSSTSDNCLEISSCQPSGGASGASGAGTSGASGASGGGHGGSGNGGTTGGSGTSGGAGASGESGAAGTGVVPCDSTQTPSTEACLVSDDFAVFVAPDGKDNAAGTMNAPVATLTKAIEVAAGSKFVIVCDATYDEHVVVSTGAQVYGGFSCPGAGGTWVAENDAPLFKPSDAGPALKIDSVTNDVVIDTVNFEVPDAKVAGGTALTAIVNAAPSVTLKNVSLTAGAGMNGADGTLQAYSFTTPLSGNPETVAGSGGGETACACQPGLMSIGGGGGPPSSSGQSGAMGLPDHGGGQPGTPGSCATVGSGRDGNDAPAATPASGAATVGTIVAANWKPTAGADGTNGSPGQGGGGGASRTNGGHGGGGGCGGCGGNGAKAGQGGGGSIALLTLNSSVTLQGCTLTTKDAGSGGSGHTGQPGQQTVGGGGIALNPLNSCAGGNGGKGGDGGPSGGGAGGISVGVLWKGTTAPTLSGGTTTTGKAGAKGIGGLPGTNDGIAGVKQDMLQVP